MSKEFVIVIEADNKRAAAAYQKGLDDLDLIMPQLLQVAQARDDKAQSEFDAKRAQELEAWHAAAPVLELDGCWLPGRKVRAEEDYADAVRRHEIYRPGRHGFDDGNRRYAVRGLQSTRAELKRMSDIASMATSPYRMTEHQVSALIAWEDGSCIENIKRRYGLS